MKKINYFEELSEGLKVIVASNKENSSFVNLTLGRFKDCGKTGYGYECFLDNGQQSDDLTRRTFVETILWIDE